MRSKLHSVLLTSSAITAVAFSANFTTLSTAHAGCVQNGQVVVCDNVNNAVDYPTGVLPGQDFNQPPATDIIIDDSNGEIIIEAVTGDFAGVQNGPTARVFNPGDFQIGGIDFGDDGDLTTIVGSSDGDGVSITTTGAGNLSSAILSETNGSVTIENHASLFTNGVGARAIVATSRDGDVSVVNTGDISTNGGGGDYTLGGRGITTLVYNSGSISVENSGDIFTSGEFSRGLQAANQLGSGNLDVTNDGVISTTGDNAQAINLFHYSSGVATITNSASIFTSGSGSDGLRVVETSFTNTLGGQNTVLDGDIVINNSGFIETEGNYSNGIETVVTITDGSPNSTISNSGDIVTSGFRSHSILGVTNTDGAIDITNSGTLVAAGDSSRGIFVSNDSGPGGTIIIENSGNIETAGSNARGIDARSIGDVGGDITIVNSGDIFTSGGGTDYIQGSRAISVTHYGAGNIEVTNDGALQTLGQFSRGISVFTNPDDSTTIAVENNGLISTNGDDAEGIQLFNYASGLSTIDNTGSLETAGNYSSAIQVNQGEFINTAGDTVTATGDGDIVITNSGNISTSGTQSRGIDTRLEVAGDATTTIVNTGDITTTGGGDFYLLGSRAISANTYGSGDVSIVNGGDLSTFGQFSRGIHAYSASSGTGASIDVSNSGDISTSGDDAEGIQLFGSSTGGSTTLVNSGDITTVGDRSAAIASFVGDFTNRFGTEISPSDNNGLTITNSGNLLTSGDFSSGISIFSSVNGAIDISTTGDVIATGALGSSGININSPDDISILIGEDSSVVGGSDPDAAGILLDTNDSLFAGRNSVIDNSGIIFSASGTAISANGGNDSIINQGSIIGDIFLSAGGSNSLLNVEGGRIISSETISLGSGNTFTNSGTFTPGGSDNIQVTNVGGNFVQTATGVLVVDIDDQAAGQQTDLVTVSGSAQLSGSVLPTAINLAEDDNEFEILIAENGLTTDGLLVIDNFAALDFNTAVEDGNTLVLQVERPDLGELIEEAVDSPEVAAAASGTSSVDLVNTAQAIQNLETVAGDNPEVQELLTAIRNVESAEQIAAEIVRLQPNNQPGQAQSTQTSATGFSNAILSCAKDTGTFSFTREDQCIWGRFNARQFDRDASQVDLGIDETGYEISGGVQFAVVDEWRLGFAGSFETIDSDTANLSTNLSSTEGERFSFGAVVKNQWGPINAYLNAAVGFADLNHSRGTILGTANGEQDAFSFLSRFRVSYVKEFGNAYVRPRGDFQAVYSQFDAFTETGAGGANLRIDDSSDWLFSFSPALEVGSQFKVGDNTTIRPNASVGLTVTNTNQSITVASFAAAPASASTFSTTQEFDNVFGDVNVGLTALVGENFTAKLGYDGRYSETSRSHAGNVKFTFKF